MKIEKFSQKTRYIRLTDIEIALLSIDKITLDAKADNCSFDDIVYFTAKASEGHLIIPVYKQADGTIIPIMSFNDIVKRLDLLTSDSASFTKILDKMCNTYGAALKYIGDKFAIITNDNTDITNLHLEIVDILKCRYDELHYTTQITHIAEIIKRMSQIDSDGSIRRLNLKEIDCIFDKVKCNIELG